MLSQEEEEAEDPVGDGVHDESDMEIESETTMRDNPAVCDSNVVASAAPVDISESASAHPEPGAMDDVVSDGRSGPTHRPTAASATSLPAFTSASAAVRPPSALMTATVDSTPTAPSPAPIAASIPFSAATVPSPDVATPHAASSPSPAPAATSASASVPAASCASADADSCTRDIDECRHANSFNNLPEDLKQCIGNLFSVKPHFNNGSFYVCG